MCSSFSEVCPGRGISWPEYDKMATESSETECGTLSSSEGAVSSPEHDRMAADDSEAGCASLDAQQHAKLFFAIFGGSESDEDSDLTMGVEHKVDFESNDVNFWTKVEEVEGLWHCHNFLSNKQQQSLLQGIHSEGWFRDPLHNQAMRFGDLPSWALELSATIHSGIVGENLKSDLNSKTRSKGSQCPFPFHILERKPLFDQMIVNSYQPGEGISAHVDLLRFEDGIAIVSLESTCVMSFQVVESQSHVVANTGTVGSTSDFSQASVIFDGNKMSSCNVDSKLHPRPLLFNQPESSENTSQTKGHESKSPVYERHPNVGVAKRVNVLLQPGDLILTHGPARYNWTHEITRDNAQQVWRGQPVLQQRRISVTLRRLCPQMDAE